LRRVGADGDADLFALGAGEAIAVDQGNEAGALFGGQGLDDLERLWVDPGVEAVVADLWHGSGVGRGERELVVQARDTGGGDDRLRVGAELGVVGERRLAQMARKRHRHDPEDVGVLIDRRSYDAATAILAGTEF